MSRVSCCVASRTRRILYNRSSSDCLWAAKAGVADPATMVATPVDSADFRADRRDRDPSEKSPFADLIWLSANLCSSPVDEARKPIAEDSKDKRRSGVRTYRLAISIMVV